MNIIAWLILGAIAGAIAKAIYPGRQGGGIFATTLLGIIGAFVGGTIATVLETGRFQLNSANFSITGLIVAILGSIVAIWIWGLFNKSAV